MNIQFYDIEKKLPLGNAQSVSLEELLKTSLFVSIHVPKTKETHHMIAKEQIELMQKGSFLINAARGDVIKADDVAEALKSGKLGGAAIDVFPLEPEANIKTGFESIFKGCPNTILTPHIGGSTEEAQANIGLEVADALISFMNSGSTIQSVNVPKFNPIRYKVSHRLLHFHKNVPGVMKEINSILGDYNVLGQVLGTQDNLGFAIIDIDKSVSKEVFARLKLMPTTIKARKIY